jgi:predicted  nucleic acid-binding Zn-ribbon protein
MSDTKGIHVIDEDEISRDKAVDNLQKSIDESQLELEAARKQFATITRQHKELGEQKSVLNAQICRLEGGVKSLRRQQAHLYRQSSNKNERFIK